MRKQFKTLLLFCFLSIAGFNHMPVAKAEDCGGNNQLPCGDNPDIPMPLDGGLAILLAAGAGYGIKKYRSEQKRKKEDSYSSSEK
jgi:hypothetical protein